MASTRLTKTFSSSGNRNKWTISMWIKRSSIGSTQTLFACLQNNNYKTRLEIASDDELYFNDEYNGNTNGRIVSNAQLKDTNAWYHIVGIWDKDNSTSGDRIRFYINGERVTSFSDTGNAPSNASTLNTDSLTHEIGAENNGNKFDGVMSHIHFCDGYAYEPSNFGETDSTTGEWKIKTSPSVSYGTNGFFILKDGNSVTDQSSNSNNWTVTGGTLTKTEDNPSNVFATLNPLNVPTSNGPTFANGNTTSTSSTTSGSYKWGGCTTLGMTSGKFYCEAKATVDSSYSRNVIGITGDSANIARANGSILNGTHSWGWYSENGQISGNGNADIQSGTAYGTGDIVMMALDLDNNKLYFGKNGSWVYSGVPTSGSTGTGAISIIAANTTNDGAYFFAQTDDTGTASPSKFEFNFGNGYFGTTAVSSAGTNASGNGIFEYDVPTGYTALSTKGLNE